MPTFTMASALKNAIAFAIATALNGGTLRIKDGSSNVLATTGALTWTATSNVVTSSDPAAVANSAAGTAAAFELLNSSGTVEASGDVGTSGATVTVGTVTFSLGVNFDEGVFTITV